ncbi:hypothetical protein B9Z50_08015 [Limnohabitans sp. Bal53]|nr:hypothetical protein B9Z50_08015 [Limnohabitans sp. Bal53]
MFNVLDGAGVCDRDILGEQGFDNKDIYHRGFANTASNAATKIYTASIEDAVAVTAVNPIID